MADLIKIKGGSDAVPELADKELGYSRDEQALYIGTPDGNKRLCGTADLIKLLELENRLAELEAQFQ